METAPKDETDNDYDDDDDDDDDNEEETLEVLPPRMVHSVGITGIQQHRLHYTGKDINDPVSLLSDDDDTDNTNDASKSELEKLEYQDQDQYKKVQLLATAECFLLNFSTDGTNNKQQQQQVKTTMERNTKTTKAKHLTASTAKQSTGSSKSLNLDSSVWSSCNEDYGNKHAPPSLSSSSATATTTVTITTNSYISGSNFSSPILLLDSPSDTKIRSNNTYETTLLLGESSSDESAPDKLEEHKVWTNHATTKSTSQLVPSRKQPIEMFDDSDSDSMDESYHAPFRNTDVLPSKKGTIGKTQQSSDSEISGASAKTTTKALRTSKQSAMALRQEERLRKQQNRRFVAEEKERERMQRQNQQKTKKMAHQVAQEARKRIKQSNDQGNGKFAKKEIAILLDPVLFANTKPMLVQSQHKEVQQYTIVQDLHKAGYTSVQEHRSALAKGCNAVQWIRKNALEGGATAALQALQSNNINGYEHIPELVIVIDDPLVFITLMQKDESRQYNGTKNATNNNNNDTYDDNNNNYDKEEDDDDDYPKLETWLRGIECGWRAAWQLGPEQRPRIILLLDRVMEALDKLWIKYRKNSTRNMIRPPTAEIVHDAVTWILLQFQVECVHCKSAEDVSNNIRKITRLLAEKPYVKQVTELECVKKIKPECSDMDPAYDRAADCWLRQLQQVPRVSRLMAMNLTCNYPTGLSLWKAYQDEKLTEAEKRNLVAGMFSENKSHSKLSSQLYTIMTSQDPNEILR